MDIWGSQELDKKLSKRGQHKRVMLRGYRSLVACSRCCARMETGLVLKRPTRCRFPRIGSAHIYAQGQTKGRREGCPPRARARPGTLTLRNIKRTGRRTNNVILFNLRFFLLFFDYTIFRIR